jgi:hypothetical protein
MTNLTIETSKIADEVGAISADARLARRAQKIMERWREKPGVGFPQVFEDQAELEALYRFFNNNSLDFDILLDSHVQKTIERCKLAKTVLILEDTTTFCFGGATTREGLGRINKNNQGFLGHFALAVTGDGARLPLGVLAVETLTRSKEIKKGKVPQKERRELPDCESNRWLRTVQHTEKLLERSATSVHVMDREGDIYDSVATMVEQNIGFVVRASSNRSIKSEDKEFNLLFDALDGLPARYREKVNVSERKEAGMPDQKKLYPSRKGRVADVVVTATTVCIKRTKNASKNLPRTTQVNMVHVFEPTPPKGQAAVEWILLTNEPIDDDDRVRRIVEIYRTRWLIEEYFKAIKTGCAYEKRQLGSYHALKNALAMTIPIAWEMLLFRHQVHQDNRLPASDWIDPFRLIVLGAMAKRYKLPENPTVRDVAYAIAGMGGHLIRNGPPGWLTLKRGYEKLLVCEEAWREATKRYDQS